MTPVQLFLKLTEEAGKGAMQRIRPKLECADGFIMSVQASQYHYCSPREDSLGGAYDEVEVGFPSEADPRLTRYADDPDRPTETVYGWVPVALLDSIVAERGGIKNMPPQRKEAETA